MLVWTLVISACSKDPVDPIGRNQPPETIAFLPENPDTSEYTQVLSWWGEDVDGEVTHYLFRFLCDPTVWCAGDTAWLMTTVTESTFYLPVTDSMAAHSFEVKAVDDDGAEDPTPARINFVVRNSAPVVRFYRPSSFPDTTLPAVTFRWTGYDSTDGHNTISHYLIWLDGQDSPYIVERPPVAEPINSTFSFGRDDLRTDTSGPRTVFLRAVDTGSDSSQTISYTWFVRQPTGRVLMVDDVPSTLAGYTLSDDFYRGFMDSLAAAGEPYTLLDFEAHGRFTDSANVYPSLEPFDAVLWYTGRDTLHSDNLIMAESGMRQYLEGGGALCLVSMSAIGTYGALSSGFAEDHLGVDSLCINAIGSDTNFDVLKNWLIEPGEGSGLDTLKVSNNQIGVECVLPVGGAAGLYGFPPGTYYGQDVTWYCALAYESPFGGRAVYVSFAPERSNGYGNARSELAKIFMPLLH